MASHGRRLSVIVPLTHADDSKENDACSEIQRTNDTDPMKNAGEGQWVWERKPSKITNSQNKANNSVNARSSTAYSINETSMKSVHKNSHSEIIRAGTALSSTRIASENERTINKNTFDCHILMTVSSRSDMSQSEHIYQNAVPAEDFNHVFRQLISTPNGMQVLHQYLEDKYVSHYCDFWEEVQKYKQTISVIERRRQARSIFTHFIMAGAVKQVNLQQHIVLDIKKELSNPPVALFDRANDTTVSMVRDNFFLDFQKTKEYQQWFNEVEQIDNPLPLGATTKKQGYFFDI